MVWCILKLINRLRSWLIDIQELALLVWENELVQSTDVFWKLINFTSLIFQHFFHYVTTKQTSSNLRTPIKKINWSWLDKCDNQIIKGIKLVITHGVYFCCCGIIADAESSPMQYFNTSNYSNFWSFIHLSVTVQTWLTLCENRYSTILFDTINLR